MYTLKGKIAAAIAALALSFGVGAGMKKISDVVHNDPDIQQSSDPIKTVTEDAKPAVADSKILINKKGMENWLSKVGIESLPKNNKVTLCSAYGCQYQQTFRFNETLFNDIKVIMDKSITSADERKNLVKVLSYIKAVVGKAKGLDGDHPGEPWSGNSKPGQMSVLDESINTMQYLYVLANDGYINFHNVEAIEIGFTTNNQIVDISDDKTWNISYDKDGAPVITEN